jgi:hypothetical protein
MGMGAPGTTVGGGGVFRPAAGAEGEVLQVLRDLADGVQYHVRFPGHTLQVPESCLEPPGPLPNPPPQAGEGANVAPKPTNGEADA